MNESLCKTTPIENNLPERKITTTTYSTKVMLVCIFSAALLNGIQ